MIPTPIRRPIVYLNRLGADTIWLATWAIGRQPRPADGTYCICKRAIDGRPMKVWYRDRVAVRYEVFHGPTWVWEGPPQLAA